MELSKSWITSSVTWTRSLMKYLVVNSHILSVLNTGKLKDVKVNCTLLSSLYTPHTHTHFCNLCLWKEKPKNKNRNGNAKETKVSLIGRRIWWTVSDFDWAFARRISYICIYINNSYLCILLIYECVCVLADPETRLSAGDIEEGEGEGEEEEDSYGLQKLKFRPSMRAINYTCCYRNTEILRYQNTHSLHLLLRRALILRGGGG